MKKKFMTMGEYAALHKVSRPAVTKWKRRGILVFDLDLVDVTESNKNLEKFRSAPKGDHQAPSPEALACLKTGRFENPEALQGLPKAELDRLLQAQKVAIAEYEKRQAKWDADIREGILVKVEDVQRIDSLRCLGLRNRLLAIPSEQAIRLANCSDPAQTAAILRDAICNALNDFLRDFGIIDD